MDIDFEFELDLDDLDMGPEDYATLTEWAPVDLLDEEWEEWVAQMLAPLEDSESEDW